MSTDTDADFESSGGGSESSGHYRETGIQDTAGDLTTRGGLRAAKEYAEMIVDTVGDGLLILDLDHTVKSANQSFYEKFGTTPEETTGRSIYQLMDGQWDLPKLHELLEEILPQDKEMKGYELDQEFAEIGRRVLLLNARQLDHRRLILLVVKDLTEYERRKEHLEALREQQTDLEADRDEVAGILESITDAFFALDEEWCFTYVNARAEDLLERTREELLEQSVWEEFEEAVGTTFYEQYHRAVDEQVAVQFEEWYPPLERWFEVRAYPRRDGGLSIFFNDINERKRREHALAEAKEQAEAASRAKSRFLANMSHELRTPLNAVIGYSEMYMEDPDLWGQERFATDMRRIREAGEQLRLYFDEILHLSKAEAGQLRLVLETFDMAALVEQVFGQIRPLMEEKGNDFEVHGLEEVGEVCMDKAKVHQILDNLLSNAAKYTRGGTVRLSLHIHRDEAGHRLAPDDQAEVGGANCDPWDDRRMLVIEVHDTGIGMSEKEQERIFEAFERGEDTAGAGGIGLGLSITHDLCELMGGTIEVESEKGTGTTFWASLPVETGAPASGSTGHAPSD